MMHSSHARIACPTPMRSLSGPYLLRELEARQICVNQRTCQKCVHLLAFQVMSCTIEILTHPCNI